MKSVSVKKNLAYNMVYQVLTILLPLVTTPYLSRVLGAAGIGEYSYYHSIAKYFVLFAMLGLNNYGNRTIAAVRDDDELLSKTFSSIYVMQILTSLVSVVVYIVYIIACGQGIIAWLMLLYVISAGIDINWLFFGLEQFKITVTRNIIIKLISTICIFVFVKDSNDICLYTIILSVSIILSQLAVWPFIGKYVHFVKPSIRSIIEHVKPNLILFIPVIAVSLYKLMDKIMLGFMSDMSQVGYYENTERIIDIPVILVQSLGTVMLPKMSNLLAKGKNAEGNRYIHNSLIFAIALSSALGWGIASIGREFVPFFFGEGFEPCINLFIVLSPSVIFMAIANVIRTQYLIPMKKDNIYIISVFLGAIVNIVANLVLIPKLAALGAALGTLIAEATVCIYQILKTHKNINVVHSIKVSICFIISGLTMFIVLIFWEFKFNSELLTIIIKVFVGAIVYLIMAGIVLLIRKYVLKRESIFSTK